MARFLSHAETVTVFQRVCIRAGINLKYSNGFNPRPKLSLPLPRSVAIESDDELLCIGLGETSADESEICSEVKDSLSRHLPRGIELIDVVVTEAKSIVPSWAEYFFAVKPEFSNDNLQKRVDSVLEKTSVVIQRKGPKPKKIDVRGFLETIRLDAAGMVVRCNITG
ncbi:MAG: TIGR03936 family radical SAM-associated protein, partial [Planctomycetota bacterium]